MAQVPQVITRKAAAPTVGVIRHIDTAKAPFDAVCFNSVELLKRGVVDGVASAGRGNTVFFTLHDDALVLRHYRRGGLVRYISQSHYLFTGFQRTRALREFDLLMLLQEAGLPAPRAYACQVLKTGLLYTASLVTYRLPGRTLAQAIQSPDSEWGELSLDAATWLAIGDVIGRFHAAGIYHADLNAHNIMIDNSRGVSLIDFDRGAQRSLPANPAQAGWCLDNMNRLERSINKTVNAQSLAPSIIDTIERNFGNCRVRWAETVKT